MSAPFWVHELAADFWQRAGEAPFPRDLRGPIARAFPLSVVPLPELCVREIDRWLARQNVLGPVSHTDRPLRACLVAHRDQGLIFMDPQDPTPEQRFSLAHELAHYLHDYWAPRRRAAARLGEDVLLVFDGVRPPRQTERIGAILAGVPLGVHVHLMDRAHDGSMNLSTFRAEAEADRLAYELLAPEHEISADLATVPTEQLAVTALRTLQEQYGLPASVARQYADLLCPAVPSRSFVGNLRVVR